MDLIVFSVGYSEAFVHLVAVRGTETFKKRD